MKKTSYITILTIVLFLFSDFQSFASSDEADCSITLVTSDYTACNTTISLVGLLSGASSSGIWTVTGEAGTLGGSSTATSITSATYTVHPSDAGNTLVFRLTASGSCTDAFQELTIVISNGATADAGIDFDSCVNSSILSPIPISGTIGAGASTGNWSISSGDGTLSASTNVFPTVTTEYTPTLTDIAVGFVELELTTDDPDGAGPCNPATDMVIITIDLGATADAGIDFSSCGTALVSLSGTIGDGAVSGAWSIITGTGVLTSTGGVFPIYTASYTPSMADLGQTVSFDFIADTGGSSCPNVSDIIDIEIIAEATSDAGTDSETCINASALTPIVINGTIGGAATTGTWSISTGNGTLSTSTNSFPNVAVNYTPTLADIAVGYIELTLTTNPSGVCSSVNDLVKISLSLAPTANAGSGFTVCEDSPINILGTLGGSATTGTWALLTGTGVLTNTGGTFPNVTATYTPTPADATTGFVEFTLTTDDSDGVGPCSAANDIVKIDITKNPSTATVGPDFAICTSSFANLGGNTPVIGSGIWTKISGGGVISNPLSPTTGVTSLSIGDNIFKWTITNGVCPPTFQEITLTRDELPTVPNAGVDLTVCDMSTATLGANTATIGTGVWTVVSGTGIVTISSSAITGVTNLSIGTNTFRWTISNGVCPSAYDEMTIIRNANDIIVDAGSDKTISCPGTDVVIGGSPSASGGSGSYTYSWSPSTGLDNANIANPTALPLTQGSTTYTLTIIDNLSGCATVSDEVVVTVDNPPVSPPVLSGPSSACSEEPISFSVTFAEGTGPFNITYIDNQGNAAVSIPAYSTGDPISVIPTNNTGMSINYTYTITNAIDANGCQALNLGTPLTVDVNPLPTVNDITGETELCVGETLVKYEVVAHVGSLYNWDITDIIDNGGTLESGGGFNTSSAFVIVTLGSTPFVGQVAVAEVSNGCVGLTKSLNITAYSQIEADAGADYSMCVGESATLGGASTATGGSTDYSYAWTPTAGLDDAAIANPTANPSATTTYTVSITDNLSGCSVATDEIIVTVNSIPTVTFASIDTKCTTDSKYQLTEGSPAGGIYSGFGVSETTVGSGIYEFDPTTVGAGTHTIDYTYTDGASCTSNATATITVEICTGVEDELLEKFSLYPNPSDGHITINGLVNENELVSVAVYDKLGKVVYQTQALGKKLGQGIDLGNLTKGIYFVKLKSEKVEYQLQKVVIK